MKDFQAYIDFSFWRRIAVASLPLALLYVTTFLCLWQPGNMLQMVVGLALIPPLIWLSVSDLFNFEIPDVATIFVAIVAVISILVSKESAVFASVFTGIIVMASLWLVGEVYFRRSGREGLGIGDAKLFGSGALLLGLGQLPDLFLLASIGGIAGYALTNLSSKHQHDGIPFGPYIAFAIFTLSFLDPLFL